MFELMEVPLTNPYGRSFEIEATVLEQTCVGVDKKHVRGENISSVIKIERYFRDEKDEQICGPSLP